MADVVTSFQAGDDVPSWLLVADPVQPEALFKHFRFHVQADVVDLPDYFLIQPKQVGTYNGLFDVAMSGCQINAATKPVWIAMRYEAILPATADARHMSTAEIAAWREPVVPGWTPSGEQVRRRDPWFRRLFRLGRA